MNWRDLLAGRVLDEDDPEGAEEALRLRRIMTEVLHMVPQGANRRPVLLRKDENDMDTDGMVDGNPVEGDPAAVALAKALTMPKPLKDALVKMVTEASERIASLLTMVKGATEGGEGLPKEVVSEIAALAAMLGGLKEKYPSPGVKKSAPEAPPAAAPAIPAAPPAPAVAGLAPTVGTPPSPFGDIGTQAADPFGAIEQWSSSLEKAGKAMSGAHESLLVKGIGILHDLLRKASPESLAKIVGDEKAAALSKSLTPPTPQAAAVPTGNSDPGEAPAKPKQSGEGWACNVNINEDEDQD
jgi:hypothetical protein